MWLLHSAKCTCKIFWGENPVVSVLKMGSQDALSSVHLSRMPRSYNLSLQAMQACLTRDSAVVRRTCMCPWRSWLAEHYFACPRQCVSACVVCSWQTYCTSVKMQAATWSTVNSMYPSSPVHHSSSLTIAQSPSSINTHSPYPCCFSSKHCPVMDSWGFWIAAMCSHSDHYPDTWRLKSYWTLATDGISAFVHLEAQIHICIL